MDKEIVIVEINYSIGVIGLMRNGEEEQKGNYGMKDKLEEISWVKKKIEVLGGDEKKVKILGESDGGLQVN